MRGRGCPVNDVVKEPLSKSLAIDIEIASGCRQPRHGGRMSGRGCVGLMGEKIIDTWIVWRYVEHFPLPGLHLG